MASSNFSKKIKQEMEEDLTVDHPHRFIVTVHKDKRKKEIVCDQLCTVLEAIKSSPDVEEKIKCPDENLIIQRGTGDRQCTISTRFPCAFINEKECLIVSEKNEVIEKFEDPCVKFYPKTEYVIFYIDKDGGENAKTARLFRSNALKKFKYVCVFGLKTMTVTEALTSDGRFVDGLENFYLKDIDGEEEIDCRQTIVKLCDRKFQICWGKKKRKGEPTKQKPPDEKRKYHATALSEIVKERDAVKTAAGGASATDLNEIYKILREQYVKLKENLEERFTQRSYQELLEIKKENFGKVQQSFNEVYRVRELLKLSKSVCKIIVWGSCEGTGFVLFDDLILTSAHLFDEVNINDAKVYALFDYDDPEPQTNYREFTCENTFVDFNKELDYAVLRLCDDGERSNPQNAKATAKPPPPGLLSRFAPVPETGEACLIGHPGGRIKMMDPTSIIEKEERIKHVNKHLGQYKESIFTVLSLNCLLEKQGIHSIMCGESNVDKVVTYDTFMYHGSSGSPIFDQRCQVFGLHTAGFTYGFSEKQSVIAYALPLLTIFTKFVSNLRSRNEVALLERIEEVAKNNSYLKGGGR